MLPRSLPLVALVAGLLTVAVGPAHAANCAGTSTGLIPVTDLGAGFYQGVQGGLYPGGANVRPAAHEAAGVAIANAIGPIDTLGQPDALNGRVVFVSIGMSNCTQEFSAFVPKSNADPVRKSNVRTIDCAMGGQTAQILAQPTSAYWDTVKTRLRGHGSSPAQAQVVWLKDANSNPTGGFQVTTDTLAAQFFRIVQFIKLKLPNVKQVFFTSRIYAGYASTTLNPEPYAYENAFAIKRVIAQQLAGDPALNYDAANGPVVAPWLSWGPYLWADGLNARSDGLTWACSELSSTDGTHPSSTGRAKVADSLLAFVRRDAATAPWYTIPGTLGVPEPRTIGAGASLSIAPNPSHGVPGFRLTVPAGVRWRLALVDAGGREVGCLAGLGTGSPETRSLEIRQGLTLPAGAYFARLDAAGKHSDCRFVLLGPPRGGH
jgi:lysophospholipase L1-like esterase